VVERQTRYVLLVRLGHDRTTAHVVEALKARIAELPSHLLKSLTRGRAGSSPPTETSPATPTSRVYF
jgi:IS30 family transposase